MKRSCSRNIALEWSVVNCCGFLLVCLFFFWMICFLVSFYVIHSLSGALVLLPYSGISWASLYLYLLLKLCWIITFSVYSSTCIMQSPYELSGAYFRLTITLLSTFFRRLFFCMALYSEEVNFKLLSWFNTNPFVVGTYTLTTLFFIFFFVFKYYHFSTVKWAKLDRVGGGLEADFRNWIFQQLPLVQNIYKFHDIVVKHQQLHINGEKQKQFSYIKVRKIHFTTEIVDCKFLKCNTWNRNRKDKWFLIIHWKTQISFQNKTPIQKSSFEAQ